MKKIYHVLINPTAGCGSGAKIGQTVTDLLEKNQFSYFTYFTKYPNHELEIIQDLIDTKQLEAFPENRALNAEERFPIIVVIGGDGTLHHVVNQLHAYGANFPVAYITAGVSNTFARALGIELDPTKRFWQIVETRQPQLVPLVSYYDGIEQDQQVFFNHFGIGLDAKIQKQLTFLSNKYQRPKLSKIAHIRSVITALAQQKKYAIRVELNGQSYEYKKAILCTITNHPFYGAGISVTSKADLFTPGFELVIVERLPFYHTFDLFNRMIRQKPLDSPRFHRHTIKKLRIITTSLEETQIDGEALGQRCFDITFSVTEQAFW